jgi:hypothetical protein
MAHLQGLGAQLGGFAPGEKESFSASPCIMRQRSGASNRPIEDSSASAIHASALAASWTMPASTAASRPCE